MITRELVIFVGNTMVAEMRLLKNAVTGLYENGAVVSVTIMDGPTAIAGPISMAYVAESRGVYRALIPASAGIESGDQLTALVNVSGPGGSQARWELPVRALTRDR